MPFSDNTPLSLVDALNANPPRAVGPLSIDNGIRMRLTGYHPALDDADKVLTLMGQSGADFRDIVPFNNQPYPSFRQVNADIITQTQQEAFPHRHLQTNMPPWLKSWSSRATNMDAALITGHGAFLATLAMNTTTWTKMSKLAKVVVELDHKAKAAEHENKVFGRQLDGFLADVTEMETEISLLKARINCLERKGSHRSVHGVCQGQRACRSASPLRSPPPRTLVSIEGDSDVEEITPEEYYSPPVASPDTLALPDGSSKLEFSDGTRVFAGPRRAGSVDRAESPALSVPEPFPRLEM